MIRNCCVVFLPSARSPRCFLFVIRQCAAETIIFRQPNYSAKSAISESSSNIDRARPSTLLLKPIECNVHALVYPVSTFFRVCCKLATVCARFWPPSGHILLPNYTAIVFPGRSPISIAILFSLRTAVFPAIPTSNVPCQLGPVHRAGESITHMHLQALYNSWRPLALYSILSYLRSAALIYCRSAKLRALNSSQKSREVTLEGLFIWALAELLWANRGPPVIYQEHISVVGRLLLALTVCWSRGVQPTPTVLVHVRRWANLVCLLGFWLSASYAVAVNIFSLTYLFSEGLVAANAN